jgi:hypothetical protein
MGPGDAAGGRPGHGRAAYACRAHEGISGADITDRLLQHAQLNAQQLKADNVAIPVGDHRVTLTIADSQGRENSRTFQFTVA